MSPRATLARLREEDDGITVLEVFIVMLLSSIILAMSVSFFAQVSHTTTQATDRRANAAQASNAMNAITSLVRAAKSIEPPLASTTQPAIISASAERLEFYSNTSSDPLDPQPVRVLIMINSSRELIIQQWATWQTSSASSIRTFEGYLSPSPDLGAGGRYLFTYLNAAGDPITTGTGALSSSQRDQIVRIQVTVFFKATTSTVIDEISMQSTVGLPNLYLETSG